MLTSLFDLSYKPPLTIIISLHPSLTLFPTISSFPSCWGNRGLWQGWVKPMSGDVCSGLQHEAVRGNAVNATPEYQGHLCVCSSSVLLFSVALHNYTACMLLLLLSGAWHSYTVGMHRAKFWHCPADWAVVVTCCWWRVHRDQWVRFKKGTAIFYDFFSKKKVLCFCAPAQKVHDGWMHNTSHPRLTRK